MIRQNLHTHTRFCDGTGTPADMAQAALNAGLTSLGFSEHSRLPWDASWGITPEKASAYRSSVADVKAAFAGRLSVFCGLEWDAASPPEDAVGYDYIIGSVHHIRTANGYFATDDPPDAVRAVCAGCFQNDPNRMADAYFAGYRELAEQPFVDIVGHFDLLVKHNDTHRLFRETSPRFLDAAMDAMDILLKAGKLFEVNTGGMGRGWRSVPFPAPALLRELRLRNARMILSSDAHTPETVTAAFAEAEALLREIGFSETWELTERGFIPRPLS